MSGGDDPRAGMVHVVVSQGGDGFAAGAKGRPAHGGYPGAPARKDSGAVQEKCRFPDCRCPMDPGPAPDWCARGLPHNFATGGVVKAGEWYLVGEKPSEQMQPKGVLVYAGAAAPGKPGQPRHVNLLCQTHEGLGMEVDLSESHPFATCPHCVADGAPASQHLAVCALVDDFEAAVRKHATGLGGDIEGARSRLLALGAAACGNTPYDEGPFTIEGDGTGEALPPVSQQERITPGVALPDQSLRDTAAEIDRTAAAFIAGGVPGTVNHQEKNHG